MKFIHAADLHLDSPFLGLHNDSLPQPLWERIRKSTFESFQKLTDDAISEKVDFVLIAGDLFDRQERSVSARVFLIQQLQRLAAAHIQVFISFGNHDYYNGDFDKLGYPSNTHVFGNDVETKTIELSNGQIAAITGFSFRNQWVNDPIINNYPEAIDADWNIGMLNGSLSTLKSPEANYAPFTLEQLKSKDYDYWALGHIHKWQSLDDEGLINYSGNTQGRHINESGDKGYLLVQSNGRHLTTEFHATAPIIWEKLQISVTSDSVDNLANTIMNKISTQKYAKLHFVRIELADKRSHSKEIRQAIIDGDLLSAVQQMNAKNWQQLNCWITSIKFTSTSQVVLSNIDQNFFDEAKHQTLTSEQVAKLLNKGLAKYPFIKDDIFMADTEQDLFNQTTAILQENVTNSDEGDGK
ncbi:metallophosphoesterase family protein [Lentilactobacillus kisonensis]|uniref:Ser/Thr phosphatase family protein n=1 Tax=Lentilactobacillus kisonensis F0435 TaxID=797516 RepID=H1LKU8_9LACO|nr:DNA repair exonuclease [Lentilactobacillus kisonensis]EHO45864.1 Ser/Thr phosphatase family protein [Lentilactobacillus kisonensis F0435]